MDFLLNLLLVVLSAKLSEKLGQVRIDLYDSDLMKGECCILVLMVAEESF